MLRNSKRFVLVIVIIISSVIAGCATTTQPSINWIIPTTAEYEVADFGEYPIKYKKIVKRYVLHGFVEPKLDHVSSPNRHYAGVIDDPERPLQYGYLVCAGINAKNSRGRYTGRQMYGFLIKNGKVATWWSPTVLQKNFCAQSVAELDFGVYPNNYEKIAKDSLNLKDPYSVIYQKITKPVRYHNFGEYINNPRFPFLAGHLVCVTLNAKNSYGGYVGYTTFGVIINGLLGVSLGDAEDNVLDWAVTCRRGI